MKHWISIMVIGLSTGVLVGLSKSPVIFVVLTSILGLIIPLIATLVGLKKHFLNKQDTDLSKSKDVPNADLIINPVPLAILLLCVVIGSMGGIVIRTSGILGKEQQHFIYIDKNGEKKEVTRIINASLYASSNKDLCKIIYNKDAKEMRNMLKIEIKQVFKDKKGEIKENHLEIFNKMISKIDGNKLTTLVNKVCY